MFTCGIPLFLLEVSVGQYLGVGGMSVVGQLCPILKGVGYSAIVMVFLENVYYIIIVAWTMFYIFNTFYSLGSGLPWSSCERGSKYYKKIYYIIVSLPSIIYIRSVLFNTMINIYILLLRHDVCTLDSSCPPLFINAQY